MNNEFRRALNDGRYTEEWNNLSAQEQKKFQDNSGIFTGYAHFVNCRSSKDERERRNAERDTY